MHSSEDFGVKTPSVRRSKDTIKRSPFPANNLALLTLLSPGYRCHRERRT